MSTAERDAASFLARWNKKADREVAFDASTSKLETLFIPLGVPPVDDVLGGGFARNRITILYGEESSGKTLITQLLCAEAQRAGGFAVFCDAERTFSPGWSRMLGMELGLDKLLILRPRILEQAFDMMIDALETLRPDVLVFDSLPALLPQQVDDKEMTDNDSRGVFPRKAGEGMGRLNQANENTAILVINQMRVKQGVVYGSPDDMPGGKKVRHEASVVLRVRRGEIQTDGGSKDKDAERVGQTIRVRTEKNKIAPPWRTAEFDVKFTGEVDLVALLVSRALELGVLSSKAGYFRLMEQEKPLAHGRDTLEALLKEDETLRISVEYLCDEAEGKNE